MLENPVDQILLLSNHPADASFLAEIAIMQHASLEMAFNEADLVARIASLRKDGRLAAAFVDVSTPALLRKFEFELQSKLGNGPALETAPMVHFISSEPLSSHREILQSPYFSFYSERKPYDFKSSVEFYENAFSRCKEYLIGTSMGFDSSTRSQCMDWLKKELLTKGTSIEWSLKFLNALSEVLEGVFPARFDVMTSFQQGVIRVAFKSTSLIDLEQARVDQVLEWGASVMVSSHEMVVMIPVFRDAADAKKAFRFYKVEK